ncbi:AMPKBI-domain-containing protein [Violaceomyces palustris]|uniref:AMPKBI-domain-containing protein n=1 Tax=Violaceomyces palustris TaxID=1673888 RepID=A0ACD0P8Q9_9BASI|nr:AMPKBI-domain-containing protein [Violaceomyces palustris]
MGNANSTPQKDVGHADQSSSASSPLHRSRSPSIKRHISHSAAASSAPISPRAWDKAGWSKTAGVKATRNPSAFGRVSSHDGTSGNSPTRSRSSSISGFWSSHRRGSTVQEEGGEALQPSPLGRHSRKKSIELPDYDISTVSSRSDQASTLPPGPSRVRKLPDSLGLPPSLGAQGFEPRLVVSPHPSPSVATQAHYASGLPSHLGHSSIGPIFDPSPVASTAGSGESTPGQYHGSEPQHVPGSAAFAPGPFAGGIFPNVASSLSTTAAASPPASSSPVVSSTPQSQSADRQAYKPPAALPSYLKIPTTIPSTYASASMSSGSSELLERSIEERWNISDDRHMHLGGGGTAAAVLNTEEILIRPGDASKVSSPTDDSPAARAALAETLGSESLATQEERAARTTSFDDAGEERLSRSTERSDPSAASASANSRTPTPTPGAYGVRSMTPTGEKNQVTALSPATTPGPTTSAGPPIPRPESPRFSMETATGLESGANTPALPPGLTSAPSDPAIAAIFPEGSTAVRKSPYRANSIQAGSMPAEGNRNNRRPTSSPAGSGSAGGPPVPTSMPIVLTWRAGGKEVFVTGTFANEWRSKIPLRRSKRDHSCVLHLPPGTHRLKFIVDDRWRVSRDLATATDGDGNLVNYVEIPNVGPAHPGPLSAPGEDLPEEQRRERSRSREERKRGSKIEAKRATMDLQEEARKAEAARRGELDDVFGTENSKLTLGDPFSDPAVLPGSVWGWSLNAVTDLHAPEPLVLPARAEERWTCEIPQSILAAQEAEEAHRDALEANGGDMRNHQNEPNLPAPPVLPRQLEKVILNSSPANPSMAPAGGTVDDNSILPAPNHVVLNHLTASAIKAGVLAVGTTTRYKRKYVTTVFYRPC